MDSSDDSPSKKVVKATREDLACVYAALVLTDDDIPVTADKIATLLQAANVNIENVWASLYARALQGMDLRQLIVSAVGSGEAGDGPPPAAGAAAAAAPEAEKKVEKKEPEPEEDSEDDDMGLSLFD